MPKFKATVIETLTQEVEYVVEAADESEARGMLESGDTVSETNLGMVGGVLARTISSDITPA